MWDMTDRSFMQALRKDPDLEGHVYLAQMFKEGRVPASVLCNAKAIYAWFKTYCSLEAPVNLQELCAYLQQKLRSPGMSFPKILSYT